MLKGVFCVYLFLDWAVAVAVTVAGQSKDFSNQGIKVKVMKDFKSNFFFIIKKTIKKTRQALHEIFFDAQNKCAVVTSIPYFTINASLFCCPIVPKNISNLWSKGLYTFPEHSLNFFSNLYIRPRLGKVFKFMMFRLLENAFMSEKVESRHSYLCSTSSKTHLQVLIINPQTEGNYSFPPGSIFSRIFFPQQKGGREETMFTVLEKYGSSIPKSVFSGFCLFELHL